MKGNWARRRWLDFRLGHTTYLTFALAFGNFILIFHRLLIERIPVLDQFFSELWVFAVFFIIIYIPISGLVGYWHRKTQLKVETELTLKQNPLFAKWFRVLIDMQTGKATKEEIENLRKTLKSIEG
jgi:hypothetical protein